MHIVVCPGNSCWLVMLTHENPSQWKVLDSAASEAGAFDIANNIRADIIEKEVERHGF